jgi:hypothetical protein
MTFKMARESSKRITTGTMLIQVNLGTCIGLKSP